MKKKIIICVLIAIVVASLATPFYLSVIKGEGTSLSCKWFMCGCVYLFQLIFTIGGIGWYIDSNK